LQDGCTLHIAPAFWQEQLAGFLISYSHHTDIGGRFAGGISSLCQSSFEEGVRIPMLKLYDAGRRNDALLEVIVANVRTPEEWVGDVDAKVASCWKGQEQLHKLLDKYGTDAWVLAGGLDSMDWLKDRLKKPKAVVDLTQIKELHGIRETNGGLEIGAMTTITEVVRHPVVREKYSLLMQAAELVASPQIRNQGTIGGNVSQDTRCWYYRGGWNCYRAGGNICYADTPTAINREHAIFDADRCVAVNPSDTAPALVALDAQMVIRGPKGERVISAEEYWIGPGIDITRMNVLQPNELLTHVILRSPIGYFMRAVKDDQLRAQSLGAIPPQGLRP